MQFSDQQKKVIDSRGKNLLVSAAAGSGKTTVLVERVLGLLREGTGIDEILIVTFTRAAAQDMRQKLQKRISDEVDAGDRSLYEQLEKIEFSSISTLHSFCSKLIRQNFELSGQDPDFRILEKADDAMLSDRALESLMEEVFGEDPEGFSRLSFTRSEEEIRKMITEVNDFLSSRPDRAEWEQNALTLMQDGSAYLHLLEQSADKLISEALTLGREALSVCRRPGGPMELESALEAEISQIEAYQGLPYEEMRVALDGFSSGKARSAKGGEGSIELSEAVKDLRKKMKNLVPEKLRKLISLPLKTALSDLSEDLPAARCLLSLADRFDEKLKAARREKSALTYNDLEHLAIRLLKNEEVRARLRQQYKYVFVDEYQDTSDIQEAIVSAVAGENNRFMVGDVKQSIYRFRNAAPELFMQKYEEYSESENSELIVLSQNFRSRAAILEFVNLLFERVMHGQESEIVYDENARLNPGASYEGKDPPVEIMLIDKSAEEETEEDEDEEEKDDYKDAEMQAMLIASRIHALMDEDKSLKYRDFCVITRVKRNVLSLMARVLSLRGIPSFADETESAFDAIEVSVLISALRILISRRREVDLLSVLRSPMFSFSNKQLAMVRIAAGDGLLFEGLEKLRGALPEAERFLTLYESWRLVMRQKPISAIIRRILEDTGYYAFVGALAGGRHRQANIDMLCELALKYEGGQGRSLGGFLEYTAYLKSKTDDGGAHELGEGDDVVRLMTAHKSKGLEFRVVFASMLEHAYLGRKPSNLCLMDRDLGLAFTHTDEKLVSERDTVARRAIKARQEQKDTAEELRVLYVTLTRAMERLILTASVKDLAGSIAAWSLGASQPDMYKNSLDVTMNAVLDAPGCECLGAQTDGKKPYVALSVFGTQETKNLEKELAGEALKNVNEALESDLWDEDTARAYEWVYPDSERVYAPLKLTVTGLSREINGIKQLISPKDAPSFLSGEDKSVYTRRGTAVHKALQALSYEPLRKIADYTDICAEIARQLNLMADRGILFKEERTLVSPKVIAAFVTGRTGREALFAETVKREWSFTLKLPAKEALPGFTGDDEILVQGCIDLCYVKDGKWVLVDYKTDGAGEDEDILSRYGNQLTLYARALTNLTGKPVSKAVIALVRQGREIEVEV
ncbi:MAG: UvrD-helicase domain-containing protein [Clostridia bacterium]|nr:UvrD-helicase domain-containing protein [Clostridia bacterium]